MQRSVSRVLAIAALLLASAACHASSGGTQAASARAQRQSCNGPGTLEVRNQSGAMVEVFVVWQDHREEYLGMVSPGHASFLLPEANALGATYIARGRSADRDIGAVVTWRSRRTRADPSGVELELRCGAHS